MEEKFTADVQVEGPAWSRIDHGSLTGKELYRTEDDDCTIVVMQRGNRCL